MPLPETIPVRYSDEEAGYVSLRPIVRQTFGVHELLDMVLRVTGKDAARVRQILRSGTIAYHYHRYWWTGFDAKKPNWREALARFPDADPTRDISRRKNLRRSCWSQAASQRERSRGSSVARPRKSAGSGRAACGTFVIAPVRETAPEYQGYSYEWNADVFRRDVTEEEASKLEAEAGNLAPRGLRPAMGSLAGARRMLFICPRTERSGKNEAS